MGRRISRKQTFTRVVAPLTCLNGGNQLSNHSDSLIISVWKFLGLDRLAIENI